MNVTQFLLIRYAMCDCTLKENVMKRVTPCRVHSGEGGRDSTQFLKVAGPEVLAILSQAMLAGGPMASSVEQSGIAV